MSLFLNREGEERDITYHIRIGEKISDMYKDPIANLDMLQSIVIFHFWSSQMYLRDAEHHECVRF
jgi:hypothetical protein